MINGLTPRETTFAFSKNKDVNSLMRLNECSANRQTESEADTAIHNLLEVEQSNEAKLAWHNSMDL